MTLGNLLYSIAPGATSLVRTTIGMFGATAIALDAAYTGGLTFATLYSGAQVAKKMRNGEGGVASQMLVTATLAVTLAFDVVFHYDILVNSVYPQALRNMEGGVVSVNCRHMESENNGSYIRIEKICNAFRYCTSHVTTCDGENAKEVCCRGTHVWG